MEEDFEAYYSSAPASQFATEVTVNNIQVGFLAFAVGILLCVPTAFILATNGANVGMAAGLFAAVGQQPKFYGLILPHGLLELSAIVVAGAAGLAVGWAIIDPGDRPRTEALAEQGRRSAVIALGLAARVRRGRHDRGLRHPERPPHVVRVAIGIAACLAFWTYVVVLGRRAAVGGLHRSLRRARAPPASNEPAKAAEPPSAGPPRASAGQDELVDGVRSRARQGQRAATCRRDTLVLGRVLSVTAHRERSATKRSSDPVQAVTAPSMLARAASADRFARRRDARGRLGP